MNSKLIANLCNEFLFSLLQRSVLRSDSWEALFNDTFLVTCLMTEAVLSSFVPTEGNIWGSLLPQSGNNCGLWIVGLCYAQSNYVFKAAVVHTGWHVTFQAKIRLMTRKSIAKGKAMLV